MPHPPVLKLPSRHDTAHWGRVDSVGWKLRIPGRRARDIVGHTRAAHLALAAFSRSCVCLAASCERFWRRAADPRARLAGPAGLAGSLNPSMPAACGLHFLNGSAHLVSFLSSSERLMASHFVRHYASLGIPASNMNFLIDPGPKNTSGPMAADLIEFGVPPGGLRTVRADRRVSGGFHTHKLRAINSALARLPNDSWAVVRKCQPIDRGASLVLRCARGPIFGGAANRHQRQSRRATDRM